MRIVLLANPEAGGGTGPDDVAAQLRAVGASVDVRALDDLRAGAEAAASVRAAARATERLLVAGGDGSLGPAAALAAEAGVPLAVVATGTANDFARALGLPRDLAAACRLAADGRARVRQVDLLWAGTQPFVNAASVGLSPAAAAAAAALKPRLGALAYPAGAARAGLRAQPVDCRVLVDGREAFAGSAWQVTVAGTGAFGGGASTGGTELHDGRLDVAVVDRSSRLALIRRAYGMLRGTLASQDAVGHFRGREAVLALPPDTPLNVDGDVHPLPTPVQFRVEPAALRVVVP